MADEREPTPATSGSFDPELLEGYVNRLESVKADIDEIMAEARDKAAPLRDDIESIKKEADEDGIPRRELNTLIQERKLLRQAEECRARLSEEQQNNYDRMKHSLGMLGELPLGASALDKARPDKAAARTH